MYNMYDCIKVLCDEKGISIAALCQEIGIGRSTMTELKSGRTKSLSSDTTAKIAAYFDVPTDFLLGNGAFFCWEEINANRKAFIEYTEIPEAKLWLLWGITLDNIDTFSVHDFIQFINATVKNITLTTDGDFDVELKEGFQAQKEKPAAESDKPDITFDDFTYAFLDESKELTEENKQKLLEMAKFFKQQQDKENKNN